MLENFEGPMKLLISAVGLGGMGMASGGALGLLLFPMFLDYKLTKEMAIAPTSQTFSRWTESPNDIFFRVYVFNVTNQDLGSIENGEKVRVKEVGPYTFKIVYHKTVESWDDDGGEVQYNLTTTFHFIENMSIGNMKEEVNFFNVPLVVGVSELIDHFATMPFKNRQPIKGVLDLADFMNDRLQMIDAKLIERHTIAELLFEGYESKAKQKLNELAREVAEKNGQPLPPLDEEPFALLKSRNNSVSGPFIAYTGKKGMENFTCIKSFDNMTEMPYWNLKIDPNEPDRNYTYCNMINGSDGSMFPPGVKKNPRLYIFNADYCRSVYMEYNGDEEVFKVPTYKFLMGKDLFEDAAKCPDNQCFCTNGDLDTCPTRGIVSLKECSGIPYYSSNPHFYFAARRHVERLNGIKPNRKKHQNYININPVTGVVFRSKKVDQISINFTSPALLDPYFWTGLTYLSNISEAMVPLYWYKEETMIDEKYAQEINEKVLRLIYLAYTFLMAVMAMGTGAVLSVTSIMLYFNGKARMETGKSVVLHFK